MLEKKKKPLNRKDKVFRFTVEDHNRQKEKRGTNWMRSMIPGVPGKREKKKKKFRKAGARLWEAEQTSGSGLQRKRPGIRGE